MNAITIVAAKEIRQAVRNRWVFAATLLLAGLALSLTFLGSAPTGSVGVRALDVVIVSLSSLTIFLVPLIALLIAHDAIVGDMERGTMLLLLSYPLARWQVLLGKFLGHLAVLAFATCLGYGAAAAALLLTGSQFDGEGLAAFAAMIGSSVLLGAVFIAIGYLVSALVRDRGTAAGVAIGLWLLLVLIYDMALLGLLVLDQGRGLTGTTLNALLLLNPTDVYRLLNLTGFANVSLFSGMAGLAGSTSLSIKTLLAALTLWTAVPLGCAALAFSRREL
jgi:Cu-processing system permease protein